MKLRRNMGHPCKKVMTLAGVLWVCTGCSTVELHEQGLVSKPNMLFADSSVYSYQSKILFQLEPGSSSSGGAKAAGCTSCR